MFARVISLKKRKDRLLAFQEEMEPTDIPYLTDISVTEGVDGKALDLSTVSMVAEARLTLHSQIISGKRLEHRDLTPGAVGCYMSHLKVWQELVYSGQPYGIVFEDDVGFDRPDVVEQVLRDIEAAPVDWDVLVYVPDSFVTKYVPLEDYDLVMKFFGLHFYVIRSGACERIFMDMLPMSQQIDSEMTVLAEAGKLKIYRPTSMKPRQSHSMGTNIQVPLKKK